MRIRLLLFTLSLLIALEGCTVLKKQAGEPIESASAMDAAYCMSDSNITSKQKLGATYANVESQLLETAKSIEQSLNVLAAAEKAESAPILNTAQLITPEGGMGGTADIDWTGPIGPLVEKIARMTNYHVKLLGTEPAIPVLISISAKRAVIADILQNASFQAGKRAHILVFPSSHLIEVRYLS
jgi:defect-in-organelle-trafficking protein DotD